MGRKPRHEDEYAFVRARAGRTARSTRFVGLLLIAVLVAVLWSYTGQLELASWVALALGVAVLRLWLQGLRAIELVHNQGTCLSQAFARNLVRCPDGVLGFIDFEDDPLASLPLALCQARDALCYVHSTALYLREAGALPEARAIWAHWLAEQPAALGALLATTAQRLAWLRHLPQDRRWGRDLQRARAAYDLLNPSSHAAATP